MDQVSGVQLQVVHSVGLVVIVVAVCISVIVFLRLSGNKACDYSAKTVVPAHNENATNFLTHLFDTQQHRVDVSRL